MKNYLIDVRFRNADGFEETSTERIKDADSQEQAKAIAQARVASQIQNSMVAYSFLLFFAEADRPWHLS
jgi:hypothetical protein